MKNKIIILDTTLRDGSQGENISFSIEDKIKISQLLSDFGVDYIEAGWPGSNPKDVEFFLKIQERKDIHKKIVAFCSTRRKDVEAKNDLNLLAVIKAGVKNTSIFGKTSITHIERVLRTTREENLKMIYDSVRFLTKEKINVIYDAEHFFDGYKESSKYALRCLLEAEKAGAMNITLCDTNGGCLPSEIKKIVTKVKKTLKTPFGIHVHNDSGLALANTITAVENGASLVQGTVNGYGERCGNADLTSIIPTLQLKMNYQCVSAYSLRKITLLSREIDEIANENHDNKKPYVGKSAFTHKGGIHVSAVQRCKTSYEHIDPELVGNETRFLISELSGKSNIVEKLNKWSIDVNDKTVTIILKKVKDLEKIGYSFEGADGSFKLLVDQVLKKQERKFTSVFFNVEINKKGNLLASSKARVLIKIKNKIINTTALGDGPVNALDKALRKAIIPSYPEIRNMELIDYKVRIPTEHEGTAAKTKVLITSKNHKNIWTTIGVSTNIIDASWQALVDSVEYYLSLE